MTEEKSNADAPECGRLLKRTRERLGLSTDDVASELRLSPFQIQALEEDDWERLPGTTYARGYLRSYARMLDLDPDKLLEGATTQELNISPAPSPDAEEGQGEAAPVASKRSPGGSPWVWVAGVAVIGVLAVYVWQFEEASELVNEMAAEAPSAGDETEPAATMTDDAETATDPATETAGQAVETTESGASEQTPLPEGWERVVLQFEAPSWVDLRDARGERLLNRSFRAGRRAEVEGLPPFRVYLGNARAVQIEYSGRSIAPDTEPGRLFARVVLDAPSG